MAIDKLVLTRGSSLSYDCTVSDVPEGATLAKAVLMVKSSLADLDEDALIAKTIYPGETADGQIADTGADGTGQLRFLLDNDDVDALAVGQLYLSGVKVVLDDGHAFDVPELTVPVRVRQAVVRAVD
jgi:hypothetical protein